MLLRFAFQIVVVSFALWAGYLIIKGLREWREAKKWALYITLVAGQQARRVEDVPLMRDILSKTKGKPGVYLAEKRFSNCVGQVWRFDLPDANIKDTWIPGGYDKITMNDDFTAFMETYSKPTKIGS